jgi:hypothetical protein
VRFITSSLRAQILSAFAAVTLVFAVGAVICLGSLSSLSHTLQAGSNRIDLADQVSVAAYNMQGSQLMNTLSNGAQASNHAGDVRAFESALAALGRDLATPADRAGFARLQQAFNVWSSLDTQADGLAAAHQ